MSNVSDPNIEQGAGASGIRTGACDSLPWGLTGEDIGCCGPRADPSCIGAGGFDGPLLLLLDGNSGGCRRLGEEADGAL